MPAGPKRTAEEDAGRIGGQRLLEARGTRFGGFEFRVFRPLGFRVPYVGVHKKKGPPNIVPQIVGFPWNKERTTVRYP